MPTTPTSGKGFLLGFKESHRPPRETDSPHRKMEKGETDTSQGGTSKRLTRLAEGRHTAACQTSEQSHEAAPERPKAKDRACRCERGVDTGSLIRAGGRVVSQKLNICIVLHWVCTLHSSHMTLSHQVDETWWPLHTDTPGTTAHVASLGTALAQSTLVPPGSSGRLTCLLGVGPPSSERGPATRHPMTSRVSPNPRDSQNGPPCWEAPPPAHRQSRSRSLDSSVQ